METVHQAVLMCTWCGHPLHAGECDRIIEVEAGPSVGKKARTERVPCPCKRRQS